MWSRVRCESGVQLGMYLTIKNFAGHNLKNIIFKLNCHYSEVKGLVSQLSFKKKLPNSVNYKKIYIYQNIYYINILSQDKNSKNYLFVGPFVGLDTSANAAPIF